MEIDITLKLPDEFFTNIRNAVADGILQAGRATEGGSREVEPDSPTTTTLDDLRAQVRFIVDRDKDPGKKRCVALFNESGGATNLSNLKSKFYGKLFVELEKIINE